jgi:hypothetical protein
MRKDAWVTLIAFESLFIPVLAKRGTMDIRSFISSKGGILIFKLFFNGTIHKMIRIEW